MGRHRALDSSALATLCCVAASPHSSATQLMPSLSTYITDTRMSTDLNNPNEKRRLEEHLKKLLYLLRTLMLTTSRRTVIWQQADDGEVMTTTDQIIQELEEFQCSGKDSEKQQNRVIDNVDVRRLLLPPSDVHVGEDRDELLKKFHRATSKLESILGTITTSVQNPQALSKSLHATVDASIQLGSLARALRNDEDIIQSHRLEESAKKMCFATFNLLKVAEQVNQMADSTHTRRRLMDAIRSLNASINKLSRAADPGESCKELVSSLNMQNGFLQPSQPTCALSYPECLEAVQNQSDVIYKLKSDHSVSREEGISTLQYVAASACNVSEYATHCAYLINISDKHKDVARTGLLNVDRIQNLCESMKNSCVKIMCTGNINQIRDLQSVVKDQVHQLNEAVNESKAKVMSVADEKDFQNAIGAVDAAVTEFNGCPIDTDIRTINPATLRLLDAVEVLQAVITRPTFVPKFDSQSKTLAASKDVVKYTRYEIVH
ncbi:talin-2-like [Battus philenor]|uniref:talin-2-like n=1 Tax=Battus philenor TaxID=42288 RepID=UPI0035CF57A3